MWISVSEEALADAEGMRRQWECSIWLMEQADPVLTDEEQRTGWRERVHGDHTHRYAVGWRAEQQRREDEARREAEMAACPYVACTCGHHEE